MATDKVLVYQNCRDSDEDSITDYMTDGDTIPAPDSVFVAQEHGSSSQDDSSASELCSPALEPSSFARKLNSSAPELSSSVPELGSSAPELCSIVPESRSSSSGQSSRALEISSSAFERNFSAPELGSSALDPNSSAPELSSQAQKFRFMASRMSYIRRVMSKSRKTQARSLPDLLSIIPSLDEEKTSLKVSRSSPNLVSCGMQYESSEIRQTLGESYWSSTHALNFDDTAIEAEFSFKQISKFNSMLLLREEGIPPENIQFILSSEHTINQRKRQGEIYELINTERSHCVAVVQLMKEFSSKKSRMLLKEEPKLCYHVQYLLRLHYIFLEQLRYVQNTGVYIERVGDILADHLCGPDNRVIVAYSVVTYACKRAIASWSGPSPNCIQSVPLRLTKYRTQLEALNKHSRDEDETEQILTLKALKKVKEVLTAINTNVDSREKEARLRALHDKMDHKSFLVCQGVKFERSDLLNNKEIIHEEKVWLKNSAGKQIQVILLLLNDILLYIQETSSGKYQFYAPRAIREVDALDEFIVREKAGTEKELYIITSKKQSHMLELATSTARGRIILLDILHKTKLAYTKQKERAYRIERDNHLIDAEKSYVKFQLSLDNCVKKMKDLSTQSSPDKEELKQAYLNSKSLQTAALKTSKKIVDIFAEDIQNQRHNLSGEGPTNENESFIEESCRILPKLSLFLDTSLRLNEVSETCMSHGTSTMYNINFDEKMEQLRSQQEKLNKERELLEQDLEEFNENKKREKAASEVKKKAIKLKEDDLKEREQRMIHRGEIIDNYFGAILTRNNKFLQVRDVNPSEVFEELVEIYEEVMSKPNAGNHHVGSTTSLYPIAELDETQTEFKPDGSSTIRRSSFRRKKPSTSFSSPDLNSNTASLATIHEVSSQSSSSNDSITSQTAPLLGTTDHSRRSAYGFFSASVSNLTGILRGSRSRTSKKNKSITPAVPENMVHTLRTTASHTVPDQRLSAHAKSPETTQKLPMKLASDKFTK